MTAAKRHWLLGDEQSQIHQDHAKPISAASLGVRSPPEPTSAKSTSGALLQCPVSGGAPMTGPDGGLN